MKGKRWLLIGGVALIIMTIGIIAAIFWLNSIFGGEDSNPISGEEPAITSESVADASKPKPPSAGHQPSQEAPQGGIPSSQETAQVGNQGGPPPTQAAGQQYCTNRFALDGSSNISTGQQFEAGESFEVSWPVKNTGTCTWSTDYSLVFVNGDLMGAITPVYLAQSVVPGDSLVLSVEMIAPSQIGNSFSAWKLQDGAGYVFGMQSPANAPLRVAIEVIQSAGNTGNSPASSLTPQVAPDPFGNALSSGTNQTMLEDQCYDLIDGEVVSCSDSRADFEYEYSTQGGAYLHFMNGTLISESQSTMPSESTCEGETYYGIPTPLTSTNRYFCMKTDYSGDTVYGWMKPTSFDANGMTFNFTIFEPSAANTPGNAIPSGNLPFVASQGSGVILGVGKCFDLEGGNVTDCGDAEADLKHLLASGQKSIQSLGDTAFGIGFWSEENAPTKTDCQVKSYLQGYSYLTEADIHICIRTNYGGDSTYGWIYVTNLGLKGITFDFLVWEP